MKTTHKITRKDQPCLLCGRTIKAGSGNSWKWDKGRAHQVCIMNEASNVAQGK